MILSSQQPAAHWQSVASPIHHQNCCKRPCSRADSLRVPTSVFVAGIASFVGRQRRSAARLSSQCWDGQESQEVFMEKDTCILVDERDEIVGSASKAVAHLSTLEPGGLPPLHRAFSVFLFDHDNRLLLQRRAEDKITFPSVWTNTCCSHPLHGLSPSEVDILENVVAGTVPGVKRAAVRKLRHELGIQPSDIPLDSFRFLTRLHYGALDSGEPEPNRYGEHEVDYILFIRACPRLSLNPAEVQDVRYVSDTDLWKMLREDGKQWSPWFRIIAEHFLPRWWDDLDNILDGKVSHDSIIHRL
eukprot:TRINITY_DN46417_c0_g1_i2.p1 TRINITY_DN46417_c0_g1~~TRINITY_DN46417_c0_g1_i2.p1  ORF type:complete len:301 (+),score=35.46 TRINITY_DN46417_c0_g1_i2:31-933(+)